MLLQVFFLSFIYLCVCEHVHVCARMHVPTCECYSASMEVIGQFGRVGSSAFWVSGIELRPAGLVASTLICWTTLPAQILCFFFKRAWLTLVAWISIWIWLSFISLRKPWWDTGIAGHCSRCSQPSMPFTLCPLFFPLSFSSPMPHSSCCCVPEPRSWPSTGNLGVYLYPPLFSLLLAKTLSPFASVPTPPHPFYFPSNNL